MVHNFPNKTKKNIRATKNQFGQQQGNKNIQKRDNKQQKRAMKIALCIIITNNYALKEK
jgi:hypothetical protein